VKLPIESKFEKMNIDPKLAAKINPVEVRPGVAVATITGNLIVGNNK
jgi:integrator complex subunit 9